MKFTKHAKGGQNARHICFESIFPSTIGNYADEEKSSQSTVVSLSLVQSVDFVYTLRHPSAKKDALSIFYRKA